MDDKNRSRLAASLEKVINTEISLRAGDLNLVEQNINLVREYLNKLRHGVCADYYDDNFKTTLQKPPHRAVKSTFKGKAPIKRETEASEESSLQHTNSRISAKRVPLTDGFPPVTVKEEPVDDIEQCLKVSDTAESNSSGAISTGLKDTPQLKYVDPEEKLQFAQEAEKRRPRYIPPVLPTNQIHQCLEPRGNKLMKKVRFLVRNNSKYVMTPEDTSGCTYKWSLNVKLNDESCDISDIVSKVIFYLHPSYKPNDVITITGAPFKITRRGWGEFNMRVRIFFINEKNEPVDITHQLVFDKLCTGMETFGGETVLDHWIIDPAARKESLHPSNSCARLEPANNPQKVDPPSIPPTIMSSEESSSSLLSAFFGELEEQVARKDPDWDQDIFDLGNLAFPEFFSAPATSNLENVPKKNEGVNPQGEGNCPTSSVAGRQSINNAEPAANLKIEAVEDVNIKIEMVDNIVHDDHYEDTEMETVELQPEIETAPVTEVVDEIKEELFLSDLSTFDDEVIITDDAESVPGDSSSKNNVDYSSVEMDDLIQFHQKSEEPNSNLLSNLPSSPSVSSSSIEDKPVKQVFVKDVKQIGTKLMIKSTPKVSSVTTQVTLAKPLRPIAPSLPGRLPVPISAVLANLPPPPKNKGSVVYVVSPSRPQKLPQTQVVTTQNVGPSGLLNRSPQTLVVNSADLPNILAGNCSPTLVMTSSSGKARMIRSDLKSSTTRLTGGSPQSAVTASPRPILIKTDGKSIPLVNLASLPNSPGTKPSILVQTSKNSGSAPNSIATNLVGPQVGANLLGPAPPPNQLPSAQTNPNLPTTLVRPCPARPRAISVRPGGTQFLLKMPDGSLKPIKMESLKPLQQGNLKLRIASSSSVQSSENSPKPVHQLNHQLQASSPALQAQKRRPALLRHIHPTKKICTLPSAPQTTSAVLPQQRYLTISSASSSHRSKQFTKLVPGMTLPLDSADESSLNDSADPEPQGMNSVKRRPPETEAVDSSSSFRNERLLIEHCPKDSVEVAFTFLLKRMSLVDVRAKVEQFKQAFPYCTSDVETFQSWPFAKQRAHELLRANDVLHLAKQAFPDCKWTRWDVMKLARMRGFTPLMRKIDTSFLPHHPLDVDDPPTDAAFNSVKDLWGPEPEFTGEIDVDGIYEDEPKPRNVPVLERLDKKGKEFMTLARHVMDGRIVEKWVEDVSIYLDPEELAPGILFPAALRLLVSVYHSFAEDLIRRSFSSAFFRYDSMEPRHIFLQDTRLALRSRPEFDLFTNVGLGTRYRQARPQPEDPTEQDRRLRNAEKVS